MTILLNVGFLLYSSIKELILKLRMALTTISTHAQDHSSLV
jgi:hypothetical protein